MKEVYFNPNGGKLYINVIMEGLYFITYTYQLWGATTNEPPIVTNPLRSGTNENPHDDSFEVRNDYAPVESISKNDRRVIDVRFWVKKVEADNAYNLSVVVYQGGMNEENIIGVDAVSGNTNGSIKEEFVTIRLVAH
jgi:hypothetical protein